MIDYLNILLGTGDDSPGLEAYGAISGCSEKILSLEKGQSVYAVDVSPDVNTIAAATKSGDIYLLTPAEGEPGRHAYSVRHSASGAPILSVCFVDSSTLAVADTAGGCFIWDVGADTQPTELPTGKRVICSLFQLDSRYLAGLSLSGRLLIWNIREGRLVKALDVPVPPHNLSALIMPVYWKAAAAWVWPGRGGAVVLFNWQRNEVHTLSAHTDNVYASLIHNDGLLTIGKEGLLRRWRVGSYEPVGSCEAPKGVISATGWGEQQFQMILVNDSGKAGIYSWGGDRLNFITWLAGHGYRVAVGPDSDQFKSALQRQRMEQANDLVTHAKDMIRQRTLDKLETLYQQLIDLGFRHVAMALRGLQARSKNDIPAEVNAYRELTQIIPHERPEARNSLVRYAELLESIWQIRGADRLYQRLSEIEPDNERFTSAVQRLSKYAKIAEGEMYVIETETPISLLVRSAAVLDEAFVGRYVLKRIEPPINCLTHISASELIEKYEQNSKTDAQWPFPPARQMELWHLSREKAEKVTTIIFASDDPNSVNCLEYGIIFLDAGLQTVLMRMTFFNAGENKDDMVSEQHNRILCEHLHRIENDPLSDNGRLQMVDRSVRHTIRQLMTRKLAEELRRSGGNHEQRPHETRRCFAVGGKPASVP